MTIIKGFDEYINVGKRIHTAVKEMCMDFPLQNLQIRTTILFSNSTASLYPKEYW